MSAREFLKANWRILVLVILVSVSLYALFVPGGLFTDGGYPGEAEANATTNESAATTNGSATVEQGGGVTNLVFGLGLDGGTRISAPPVGITAEDVEMSSDQRTDVRSALLDEFGLDPADVIVRFDDEEPTADVEIFTDNVSHAEFAATLTDAGVETGEDDVRDGVTQQTRDEMISTIDQRISQAGLAGGQVFGSSVPGGGYYIETEVPAMSPSELRQMLQERGSVEVWAHYPGENGTHVNETILAQSEGDIVNPGSASYDEQRGQHYVPVTVAEHAAEEYQSTMNDRGFTSEGVGQCAVKNRQTGEYDFDDERADYCLLTVVDGEVVDAHSMGSDLATNMQSGEWTNDPTFRMIVPTQTDAHQLSIHLNSGALTAPLDFGEAQVYSLEPALAEQFKTYSLLIGLAAILAVSGMVYLRYRDPRVALPMILTASTEVIILLGFAAAIRMPLDLAHAAGFIAVVGTGVDDLVIIADEVMDEGDVSQHRVFDSRFKKAFWVIGAAAATTIIAMSPLAVLSLGDLQGFAIVTILGVLIGVFVSRPAYGDILRKLLLDDEN